MKNKIDIRPLSSLNLKLFDDPIWTQDANGEFVKGTWPQRGSSVWNKYKDILTYQWVNYYCKRNGVRITDRNGLNATKKAVKSLHQKGILHDFFSDIEGLRKKVEGLSENHPDTINSGKIVTVYSELSIDPPRTSYENSEERFKKAFSIAESKKITDRLKDRIAELAHDSEPQKDIVDDAKYVYNKVFLAHDQDPQSTLQWVVKAIEDINFDDSKAIERICLGIIREIISGEKEAELNKRIDLLDKPGDDPPVIIPTDSELQQIYNRLLGKGESDVYEILNKYFPDTKEFDRRFRAFLEYTGINVKSKNRSTWIKKVAKEICESHQGVTIMDEY